ncbi:hypothetical protein BH11GEM2_BH11GEM2_01880 [soil metagenome]
MTQLLGLTSVVVPVRNALGFLPRTVPSVLAAARWSSAEVIYVDNGSTDGSAEYLASIAEDCIRVCSLPRGSIAGVRNFGAGQAHGEFLSFLDSDCAIEPDYFEQAVDAIRSSGAAATGFQVDLPPHPNWIEVAWHELHHIRAARNVKYLNSGNFFTRRSAFEGVGGFREDLTTGEDAELGQRYNAAGFTIFASPAVKAVHLGNPQTLPQFYRRMLWHGLGMFGTVSMRRLDRPTAMMLLHFALSGLGLATLFLSGLSLASRVTIAIGLQAAVPIATVMYRQMRTGRRSSLFAGVSLYWLYYWARIQALGLVALKRTDGYWR